MNARKEIAYLIQVAIPFAVLGWWKHPAFYVAAFVFLLSLPFAPARSRLISGWQNLGILIGKVISPIVMSFIYYLALTPLALLRKALGTDELQLKKPSTSTLKSINKNKTSFSFDDLW